MDDVISETFFPSLRSRQREVIAFEDKSRVSRLASFVCILCPHEPLNDTADIGLFVVLSIPEVSLLNIELYIYCL